MEWDIYSNYVSDIGVAVTPALLKISETNNSYLESRNSCSWL